MRYLTWGGRASVVWYAIRGLIIKPAPPDQRCFMGAPVGSHVHCPRRIQPGSDLWCRRHEP